MAALSLVIGATVTATGPVPASAAPACTQVTDSGDFHWSNDPVVSADGSRIAFRSRNDLVDQNPDLNEEIFLYDAAGPSIVQITDATRSVYYNAPTISSDGSRVAFIAADDLTGDNPDHNAEVFLWDEAGPTITQLTDTLGGNEDSDDDGVDDRYWGTSQPSISADGSRVAFLSRTIGGGTPNGDDEVFLWGEDGPTITQVTETPDGWNNNPSISADGSRIAFRSNGDLVGENPDNHHQIYTWDLDGSVTTQITHIRNKLNAEPSISADGSRVAYWRTRPGSADIESGEIYLYDATGPTTTRVTRTTGGSGLTNFSPAISADGSHLAFTSTRDLIGANPRLDTQIFTYDIASQSFQQITDTTGGNEWPHSDGPALSADGSQVAFSSTANIQGGNLNNNGEIFLSDDGRVCSSPGRPDGHIRRGATGSYLGDDVYDDLGVGQTVTGAAPRGASVTYSIEVENDSVFPDRIRLKGTASSTRFTVRYRVGSTDITAGVVAGTYQTPTLAHGATQVVKAVVTVGASAPAGATYAARVHLRSVAGDGAGGFLLPGDTVKFVTARS